MTSRALGNNLTQNYSYYGWTETAVVDGVATGQGGRLKNLTVGSLMNLTYTYDKSGNIRKINSTATAIETQNFTYDVLDRLITANATGGPAPYSESYTYNATTGNLATKGSLTLQYNDAAHVHAVTNAGSNTYSYDANGSQITRVVAGQTYNLAYDAENRLVEVKKNGAVIAALTYDGDEQQVKAIINGVTTYFAGAHYHVENGQVTKYYFAGAQRVAVRKNGTLSYLLSDHLGSTVGITNTSGTLTGGTLYKAWGETRYTLGSIPTKFKYTGQREESAFGLYFYQARWYDPVSGRFSQADTIVPAGVQGLDRYAYVGNSPVRYTDPSGHCRMDDSMDECFSPSRHLVIMKTIEDLMQKAIDNPTDHSWGERALNMISNYYGLNLSPNDHWEYEQKIVILFGTGGVIGGYTPRHPGETFYVPANDLFGNMMQKTADDYAVYVSGQTFQDICSFNVACVASIMAHEAAHSWVEFTVEQKYGENSPDETLEVHTNHELFADEIAMTIVGDPLGYMQGHTVDLLGFCSRQGYACGDPRTMVESFYNIDLSALSSSILSP